MDKLTNKNSLKIIDVKIIGDVFRVIFNDSFEAIIGPDDVVGSNPGSFGKDLLNPKYFVQVIVDAKGRLVWPNDFSVHPVHLYEYLTSKTRAA